MHDITSDLIALLERDRGLPGRFFTDEAIFKIERHAVFENGWFCIGLAADVSANGHLFPVTALGWPLLMAREGIELHVFHNVCSHRGALLSEAPARSAARIVCPYHSWTYKLNGELVATPHVGGANQHVCEGFDRQTLGLRKIRCAEWAGHVFVNLSGTAPPFEQWIRPLTARFAEIDWTQLRRDAAQAREVKAAANWKIIIENFVESYHLPWVHRTLNAVNPMHLHYQILGGHSYLGQGGIGYQGARVGGGLLPMMKGLQNYLRYESVVVLPNLILGPLPDMAFSIIVLPESAAQTRERLEFFFVGDESLDESLAAARGSSAAFIVDVNSEDVAIVESVQCGRHSPAFVGGRFAPAQEATSLQFQKTIASRISCGGSRPPEDIVQLPTGEIMHPPAKLA